MGERVTTALRDHLTHASFFPPNFTLDRKFYKGQTYRTGRLGGEVLEKSIG